MCSSNNVDLSNTDSLTVQHNQPDCAKQLSQYRLAAIDLDGTLLDCNAQISEANCAAIKTLVTHKLMIVLASGRNYHGMVKFQQQLQISGPILSHHGALVKNPLTNETIFSQMLAMPDIGKLIAEADKYGATPIYYCENGIFTSRENELTASFNKRSSTPLNVIDSVEWLQNQLTYKIIWMHDPGMLSQIYNSLDPYITDNFYVVHNQPEYLEFLSVNTNKAIGLEAISKHFNIPRAAIVSFGDGDNDAPMLSWAGLGIAMHHATDGAKKAANIIASPGEPETGFARAVNFLLT